MPHVSHGYQKSITHLQKIENILAVFQSIICYNIVTIILWHQEVCGSDEVKDDANENNTAGNYRINNQIKTTGCTRENHSRLGADVAVPLTYLRDLPLINWEIMLDLS